jgi:hypothetical protein
MGSILHLLDRLVSVHEVAHAELSSGRWTEDVAVTPTLLHVPCRFSSPTGSQMMLGMQAWGVVVMSAYFPPGVAIETGQVLVDEVDGRQYNVRMPAGDNAIYSKFLVSWWQPSERSAIVV